MKRILLALFFAISLFSCSSDDDFELIINESDLHTEGEEGLYYEKDNNSLFILYENNIIGICAGNRKCPNKNHTHKYNNSLGYIRYASIDNTGIPYFTIYCGECKSFFYLPSGKSVEDGRGNVEMYNVSYNKESKSYRVWK